MEFAIDKSDLNYIHRLYLLSNDGMAQGNIEETILLVQLKTRGLPAW